MVIQRSFKEPNIVACLLYIGWACPSVLAPAPPLPDSLAQIRSADGICLQPTTPGIPGSALQMSRCDGTLAQRWWFEGSDLRPDKGFLCLTKEGVDSVVLYPCNSPRGANQKWGFDSVAGLLQLAQITKCLSAPMRKLPGSSLEAADCDLTVPNQKWVYASPQSFNTSQLPNQGCDPACGGLANCVEGRCRCSTDHQFGTMCEMTCVKYCTDDVGGAYCCVSKQLIGSGPSYKPAGYQT